MASVVITKTTNQQLQHQNAAWLMAYCQERGGNPTIVPQKMVMPTEAVTTHNGYRMVPFDQDCSPLPQDVDDLVWCLEQEGISTKQMVIIHEPDPKTHAPTLPQRLGITPKVAEKIKKGLVAVGAVVSAVAAVVAIVLAAVAVVIAVASVLTPLLFVGAALVGMVLGGDPILVVIFEDGTAVQIAEWTDKE